MTVTLFTKNTNAHNSSTAVNLLLYPRLKACTMKFCKNLQRVVDISDPEWAPYWTNYKMLKVSSLSTISSHESSMECQQRTVNPIQCVNLDESNKCQMVLDLDLVYSWCDNIIYHSDALSHIKMSTLQ